MVNVLVYRWFCGSGSSRAHPRSGESRVDVRLRLELVIREYTACYDNKEVHTSDIKLERRRSRRGGGEKKPDLPYQR